MRVDVNRVTEEDFVLQISMSDSVVVVKSDAPMTDINMSTDAEIFSQMQIRELPILSRNVNNLALLAPGVESVRTFSFANTLVPFAVSGSWGRYNNFVIIALATTSPYLAGPQRSLVIPTFFPTMPS